MIEGAFAGPMAYLALKALARRQPTFAIESDHSAYITQTIREESAAWWVGDPEREAAAAAAAAAEAPILVAYRAVVVPRPDEDERGLGVSMADAVAALHARRPQGEGRSPVLLHVCGGNAETYDALIRGGEKLPSVRAALADLHSRAYPQHATWTNYNTKKGPRPSGCPYTKTGDQKKYLVTWACRGFMAA